MLAALCPDLLDLPLAGSGWKSGPRTPPVRPAATAGPAGASDWRRAYGDQMARLLRDYALDLGAAGGMFDLVRRAAAERALRPPQPDSHAAWALATLAALLSGDWLNAREGRRDQPRPYRVSACQKNTTPTSERDDRPADGGQPQLAGRDGRVAVGLQCGNLLRVEQGAFQRVVRLGAGRVITLPWP